MRRFVKYLLPALAAILFASMVTPIPEAQAETPLPAQRTEAVFIGGHHFNRSPSGHNAPGQNKLIRLALLLCGESGAGIATDFGPKHSAGSAFGPPYASGAGERLPAGLSPAPEPPADRTVQYVYALRKILV